jgi:hypothetical protein
MITQSETTTFLPITGMPPFPHQFPTTGNFPMNNSALNLNSMQVGNRIQSGFGAGVPTQSYLEKSFLTQNLNSLMESPSSNRRGSSKSDIVPMIHSIQPSGNAAISVPKGRKKGVTVSSQGSIDKLNPLPDSIINSVASANLEAQPIPQRCIQQCVFKLCTSIFRRESIFRQYRIFKSFDTQ